MKKILTVIILIIIVFLIVISNKGKVEEVTFDETSRKVELIQIKDEFKDSIKEVKKSVEAKDKDLITISLSKLALALEKLEFIGLTTEDQATKDEITKMKSRGNSIKQSVEIAINDPTNTEIILSDTLLNEIDSLVNDTEDSIQSDIDENPEVLDEINVEDLELDNPDTTIDESIDTDTTDETKTESDETTPTEETPQE